MNNQEILQQIQALVEEEHRLRDSTSSGAPNGSAAGEAEAEPGERLARLRQVEEALDQCWDLLRQRRAKAKAGEDPNEADARPVSEVEGYRQ
ncbi:DUF2630 family protein [Arthrobacter sp. KBS0703]|jgi:hypothetical protein|uniref:DUF2630 family protein n=1 Tax=Bacteria TaxID=2 RepID=UPI00098E9451|nr:DUF2630 family protein [Arthrobacter sp. KBS0703]TSE16750.1 DUF2630 family protein [Arthrobacter sp. KBS0703]